MGGFMLPLVSIFWSHMSRLTRGLSSAVVCALGAAMLLSAPTAAVAAEEPLGIRINEVVSNGGSPDDWIEFYNYSDSAIDLSFYVVQDNSDKNPYEIPAGTVVAPGAYYVIDTLSKAGEGDFDFGLGKGDSVRLFAPGDANGAQPLLQTTWPADTHAVPSWGAEGDGADASYLLTTESTKGAANVFPSEGGGDGTPDPVAGTVVLNEVDSQPADWVELYNPGAEPLDISGYELRDSDDDIDHRWAFAAGTVIDAGEFLLVEQGDIGLTGGVETPFGQFGIGSADEIRLFDPTGVLTDRTGAWTEHAAIDGDFIAATYARCSDGVGEFTLAKATPGAANECAAAPTVAINEVESDGEPDWVELANPTAAAIDVSGLIVKDDDDRNAYAIDAGTSIPAGGHLLLDDLGFGIGKGDMVRLFDGDGLIDSTSWGTAHAPTTWGRCPDATGPFAVTASPTPGAANTCAADVTVSPWPGSPDVRVLDSTPTFLEDSSGLDMQETADGTFLWAVDNDEGRIWKLTASVDGSVSVVDGWADGKRVRFQKDAANPDAAGPDTEGITVAGDGLVYVASERDNSAKGVNQNKILQVDPTLAGPDLVAVTEWDLTDQLPAVGANLGIEAVEWVPDATLAGALFDDNTKAPYDGSSYAGDGLFFVAVEDGGGVYAFALAADGSAELVSTIDPGLAGVMALDYDSVLGVLWAVCDDGCGGTSAQITLNGTDQPGIAHFARPAALVGPDGEELNDEGFATAPASLSKDGERPVWWFADGYSSSALRTGTLPGVSGGEGPGTGPGTGPGDGSGDGGSEPGPSVTPLPGTDLVEGNTGGATVTPPVVAPGGTVTITVGAQHAGIDVEVWMYSDPTFLAHGTLNDDGAITVIVPKDAPAGAHRLAVYSASGDLLGWVNIDVKAGGALATTGTDMPAASLLLALALLLIGGGAAAVRRRRVTAAG